MYATSQISKSKTIHLLFVTGAATSEEVISSAFEGEILAVVHKNSNFNTLKYLVGEDLLYIVSKRLAYMQSSQCSSSSSPK